MSTRAQRSRQTQRSLLSPDTVPGLVRMLNVKDASADKQAAALKIWLKANPPSPSLRLSLLANGYGHVLDEAVGRMPRGGCWRKHPA